MLEDRQKLLEGFNIQIKVEFGICMGIDKCE